MTYLPVPNATMDLLQEFYELVFPLEDFLEIVLNKQLLNQFRLRDVFKDVVCVSDENSIKQFYNQSMTNVGSDFAQFILSLERSILEKNLTNFVFEKSFFTDQRFRYLYALFGEDYFCLLFKNFNVYEIDRLNNCYIRFGRPLDETSPLPDDLRLLQIDLSKLNVKANLDYCSAVFESIGREFVPHLVRSTDSPNKTRINQEMNKLIKFLDEHCEKLLKHLKNNSKKAQLSYLITKSPKMAFYRQPFIDRILDKERIYENQELDECRERFINQFNELNVGDLIKQIFKEDTETLRMIHDFKIYDTLYGYLNHFILQHKTCEFIHYLNETCPVDEIDDAQDQYEATKDLAEFVKQDQVNQYIKTILGILLDPQLFGKENTARFLPRFFNLILFQNGDIDIYYSAYFFKFVIKETDWLPQDKNWEFKGRVLFYLLYWLSNYVIDLLSFSFFVVKETRLRFYRYDYWMKIRRNQLNDWIQNDKIAYFSYEQTMPSNQCEHLDLRLKIKATQDFVEIHSLIEDPRLEEQLKIADTILKVVCNDGLRVFKSEIDFYNQLKAFLLNLKMNEKPHGLKIHLEDQLPQIPHKKLIEILFSNLQRFYSKYGLDKVVIKRAIVYTKIKEMQKDEIYYVDLAGVSLLDKLRLAGHQELYNSVIYAVDLSSSTFDLQFAYQLAVSFIKANRLRINEQNYLMMKEGLSNNKYLTKQLLILYVNDLVEKNIPELIDNPSVFYTCDSNQLIVITTDQVKAGYYFSSIIQNLPLYKLYLKNNHSYVSFDTELYQTCSFSKGCHFNNFQLRFNHSKFINYRQEAFNIRNIKSSYSFHLFELPYKFKTKIVGHFIKRFKFFELDESCATFEEVIYTLFAHFSFFAAELVHFFENTLLLCKDENSKLLAEIIFDLIYNFIHQIEFQMELIPDFKFSIDTHTLIWLIIKCFLITWTRHVKARENDLKMLRQIETWNNHYFTKPELNDFELSSAYTNLFKDIDFSISKSATTRR